VSRSLASVVFFFWLFVLLGAPVAYAATFVVVWPIAHGLEARGRREWWPVTVAASAAGGATLPMYTHALAPRGEFSFSQARASSQGLPSALRTGR